MHLVLSQVVTRKHTRIHLLENIILIYAFINLCWSISLLLAFVWPVTSCRVDLLRRYHSLPPQLPRAVSAFYSEEFMINISNDEERAALRV